MSGADDFWRTDVLAAISDPACTRDDVAVEYATAIRAYGTGGEWREINAAIIERWSLAGLRYVKEKAWKLARSAAKPPLDERGADRIASAPMIPQSEAYQ